MVAPLCNTGAKQIITDRQNIDIARTDGENISRLVEKQLK